LTETTDIVGGAAAAGTFIGTLWAALKFGRGRKTEESESMLAQRIDNLERRCNEHDERLKQHEQEIGQIFNALSVCTADVREALTRLQERRRK